MRGAAALVTLTLTLPPAAAPARAQDEDDPAGRVHGSAAAFSLIDGERERIWLPAGSVLFERPDAASVQLDTIDTLCEIEVLERSGEWYRVHHDGRLGWVRPEERQPGADFGLFPAPEPLAVETPGFTVDEARRRRDLAQAALGLSAANGRLGPWELLTDVSDQRLIAYLDRIAAGLPPSYRERFGLEPTPPAGQAVAVFATEEAYRPFEAAVTNLGTRRTKGHAGGNLAALFVENDRLDEAARRLVHELTHLMNQWVLGPAAPPWVEEGVASDLAYSRIDRDGRLQLGSVNGERIVLGDRASGVSIQYTGAMAALAELLRARARRQATPLGELVRLDQSRFLDRDRGRHYIESAFLVRFLLEGEKGRYAEGFRAYLQGQTAGASSGDPITLLGTDWPRLERAFDAWLRLQSVELLR